MTINATTNKTPTTTKTKSNGEEHPSDPAVSTSPATSPISAAPEKKPVTVMIPEVLHRKAKITAELSGTSLSDLVEAQLKAVVKEKLPGLLAGLEAEG